MKPRLLPTLRVLLDGVWIALLDRRTAPPWRTPRVSVFWRKWEHDLDRAIVRRYYYGVIACSITKPPAEFVRWER